MAHRVAPANRDRSAQPPNRRIGPGSTKPKIENTFPPTSHCCLLYSTAALLQHYAPQKPVRWMVLAAAVSSRAGAESLRGPVLFVVWTWTMIPNTVVLSRARAFLLSSPSVSIPGRAASKIMHTPPWHGRESCLIGSCFCHPAAQVTQQIDAVRRSQSGFWPGRDQSHFPIWLAARAKDRGEGRAKSKSARASLQRNAKTNARVNGQWGPLGPIGAGAARAGRGTAATRTGVSSPAPWLLLLLAAAFLDRGFGAGAGLWAGEVRVLVRYWHWHWSTGSLAQLPFRSCPSPHVASSSSSFSSLLLALVLIQLRCSAVVNLPTITTSFLTL